MINFGRNTATTQTLTALDIPMGQTDIFNKASVKTLIDNVTKSR